MDIRMLGMDGIKATRRITSAPETSAVRVLILTTFDLDKYATGAEVAPVLRSQLLPGRQGSAQMVVRLMSLPSSMRWPGTS